MTTKKVGRLLSSALGKTLARELNSSSQEADDFYWLKADPPFTKNRPVEERRRLMIANLEGLPNTVFSGSVIQWGDEIENALALCRWHHEKRPFQNSLELAGSER